MHSRRALLKQATVGFLTATAGCTADPDDQSGTTGTTTTPTDGTETDETPSKPTEGTERATAGESGWAEETEMPAAQSDIASGVVDGKLYCFGGIRSGQGLDATARGFVYDPTDGEGGSWSGIPDLPKPLWGQCGVSDRERIFVFGGAPEDSPYQTNKPPTDEIFVFDPGDGWTNLSETAGVRCPYPTWVMQGVYNPHDGLIYNVGGAVFEDENYGDESNWVWRFDPDRCEVVDAPLTKLPTKRRWSSVGLVEIDGSPMLHVLAGQADQPMQTNDRYDIEADEWQRMAQVPEPGIYAPNYDPVIGNRIYLTHGLQWQPEEKLTNDAYERTCWEYDPVADSWNTDLATPRHRRAGGAADGVIDGTLFIAGGHQKRYDSDNYHETKAYVESFTP